MNKKELEVKIRSWNGKRGAAVKWNLPFCEPHPYLEISQQIGKEVFLHLYRVEKLSLRNIALKLDISVKCVNFLRNLFQARRSKLEIQKARERTNLKIYGGVTPLLNPTVQKKSLKTIQEKYGPAVVNVFQAEQVKESIREKIKEKFGVENPSQADSVKDKKKTNSLVRYGVTYPLQSEEIKAKIRTTNFTRYGVSNPQKDPIVQERTRITNQSKYGTDNPSKSELVKGRIKATNQERYGVDWTLQDPVFQEKRKATNLEKYGYENAASHPDVKKKIENSFLYYDFTFPSGKKVRIQGYEKFFIQHLLDEGVSEDNVVVRPGEFSYAHPNGSKRKYRPDLWIRTLDTYFEVKSDYYFRRYLPENVAKAHGVVSVGKKFLFVVIDPDRDSFEYLTIEEASSL